MVGAGTEIAPSTWTQIGDGAAHPPVHAVCRSGGAWACAAARRLAGVTVRCTPGATCPAHRTAIAAHAGMSRLPSSSCGQRATQAMKCTLAKCSCGGHDRNVQGGTRAAPPAAHFVGGVATCLLVQAEAGAASRSASHAFPAAGHAARAHPYSPACDRNHRACHPASQPRRPACVPWFLSTPRPLLQAAYQRLMQSTDLEECALVKMQMRWAAGHRLQQNWLAGRGLGFGGHPGPCKPQAAGKAL